MSHRIALTVGPSPSQLKPMYPNDGKWVPVVGPNFEGRVAVHANGHVDENGNTFQSPYFELGEDKDRKNVSWSVQAQGRVLQPISVDDLLVGVVFEEPLNLPWGVLPLISFLSRLNPQLKEGASEARPWVTAPLLSTATYASHIRHPETEPLPPAPPLDKPIREGIHTLVQSHISSPAELQQFDRPRKRRAYFANLANRSSMVITPSDVLSMELCYGRVTFPDLRLRLPFGITLDLLKLTGNQRARTMLCRRNANGGRPKDEDILFCWEMHPIIIESKKM
ncbi:hypothetical protein BOTBODRAFT_33677 [Botryobasidium botryosum FD-172 SS1]|uniref:Domain of unknown function at the cortex 1 domain-containing protein n=1 Tax=Botryobasidium botryosum (strain FD-172 SS1) TaxID=930990 RepID=A0A067MP65_BOTB1|nr:hypothetical protein BOTBODRAFT_33677 [Botryobasidium botryosum FD-172 SS1]